MQKNFHPQNPTSPTPEFDKLVWRCPCCGQDRTDKYIKVMHHDISEFHDLPSGTVLLNVKYCVDMPGCKEKAFDRRWVINKFIPGLIKDERLKIDVSKS